MPILKSDPELYEQERREEWDIREYQAQLAEAEREHEYRVAKLKFAVQPRRKAVERVVLALVKVPVCIVLTVVYAVLILSGREVPKVFDEFLSL